MLKEISPVYQNIVNGVMTGTTVILSVPTNITYKDSIAIQLQWTGSAVGTFEVQGSLDYNPGAPQSGGTANAGNWISLTLSPSPAASGTASQILINLNQLSFPWIRVKYTNASSTGTLNGYISAKSLG